jgi:predicted outer membrane repeat protein
MFTDGRIRLTLLASTANQGLIGLSEGAGVPAGFYESDFSAYPETPPAFDGGIQPANITGQLGGFTVFRSWRYPFPGQPATIRWRHNGVPMEDSADVHGAHGFLLSLSNLKAPDAGNYDAVLTSYSGQTTISDPAVLFVSPEIIANGSFEQNLDGWHASGNVSVESTAPYTSTDGSKILAFNSGNRPPDGALSQTFACALISPYLLEFDVGVLAYNTSEQRLQVTGGGSFSPVSDIISISGTGGGHVNWLSKSYILNSVDKTHMSFTFRDVSTTTDSVDLLLDHVRVTPLYGLRVSVSPYGLTPQIDVSPPDVDAKGGGIAEFHRLYRKGESVRLTAPAEVSGQPFLKWRGAAYGSGREVTVTMNSGVSMEAVYGPLDSPLIDSASTATTTQGFHFQYGISATNRPESYFAEPLPDGLALSGEIISGVPTTPGTYSINLGATNAGGTGTAMLSLTVLPAPTDFLAEIFDASDMDTAFQSFTFTPDASANRYTVTRSGATVFHTDPAGGQPMPDGRIYLDSGTSIPLFGKFYDSLLIASNGSVALGDGYYPDSEPLLSPGRFMGMPGVAALFSDLAVPKYGSISWKQLADRVAVTFQSLQDRQDLYEPATGSNNFQIELFFDGRIRITLLGVTAKDGIIGLSRGEGVSAAFVESDFSNCPLENGVALTPISDFHSAGPVAGPFSPASKTYVLSNAGPDPLDWTATCGAGWLIASPAGGTLASGASTQMDVTLQPTASSLTAGNYHCDLTVSTAAGSIVRRMGLDVSPIPPAIDSSLGAAGRQGFPFNYQITAAHGPTSYAATILPDGLSINPASGLISGTPTGHGEFVVQLSAINDAGTGNALLTMTIDPLPPAVVTLTGDADPGWPRQSEWAYGTPTGSGGSSNGLPDPAAGATGTHVFGVNLGGDYSLTPGGPFYLTAGPFDLSEADQTVLQFRRWLNTDFLPWAGATLEISADGQNWALLWTNGANPVIDTGWQSVRYDISQVADHGSSVFIRWGYQVQAGALAYSGWNIDDIEILANTPLIVTTPIDENDGALGLGSGNSLREVLAAAAAIPGTNDIRFGWSLDGGTINIGTAIVPGGNQLNVDSDVTIDASDLPSKINITGSGVTRVFEVLAGTHVSFVDLMIQNGNTISSLDSRGGGILNHGNLALTGCVVRDSTSDFGGGLFNEGTLTLTRSVILENQAAKHGGGIANTIASTTLTDSIVRGNSSGSSGGGIVCWGAFGEAHVTLNNSEVTNNTAVVAGGGYSGGLGYKMWGNMTATNTTFSGNSAGSRGGAIRMDGLVHLISSTVAGNYCNEPAGEGGGIFTESGFPDILSLENTIVAANNSTNNPDLAGTVTEQTGNNFVGGDPMLAPLNPYGGFTSTMPPLPGSPVIDAAIPLATTPATDQRGAPRPTGPLPDIGAVEAFPFSSLALLDSDHDGIDDRLEPAYGLTVGADDSIQDSDGDGSRDAEEIANMTDPLDPDSSLKITSFSPSPGFDAATNALFDLSFTSFPGLSYSLEFSQTIDFSGPDLRVQALGPATAYSTGASVQLQPPADFVRVRRNP